MTLGILQCDHVADDFAHIAGDYDDMFRELFAAFAPRVELRVYDVTGGQFPESLDECRGYLITGSRRSVYEPVPWIEELHGFVRRLHAEDGRLVGVCFGHQLMARALGGRVEKAPQGWGIGVHTFEVSRREAWMEPPLDRYGIVMSCQDQVVELPPGAVVLAGSDFCPVGMFRVGDRFLGIQGHPELPVDYAEALMLRRRERIGAERVSAALETLAAPRNQREITAWIANFLERP